MNLLKLFASTAHITYNKYIAKELGVDEAILFGELCSKYEQFTEGELDSEDDEFYCVQEQLIEDTCLTEYRLRNALKSLQENGWLTIIKKGIPAKNWYKLNDKKILELANVQRTSSIKFNTTRDSNFNSTRDSNFNTTILNKKEINKKEINNKKCVSPKISTKISRQDKILKMIQNKIEEYDLENLEDKILEFYKTLLANKKLITEQKVNSELFNLAKENDDIKLKTIQEALNRGWQSLNPEWVKPKKQNYNIQSESNNNTESLEETDRRINNILTGKQTKHF